MLNVVALAGRLVTDPEPQYSSAGNVYCRQRVAVDDFQNKKKVTYWLTFVFFGRTAEILAEYARKGDMIAISGKLSQSQFERKDGTKGEKIDVIVNDLQLTTSKARDGSGVPPRHSQPNHAPTRHDANEYITEKNTGRGVVAPRQDDGGDYQGEYDQEEDVPF